MLVGKNLGQIVYELLLFFKNNFFFVKLLIGVSWIKFNFLFFLNNLQISEILSFLYSSSPSNKKIISPFDAFIN